MAAGDAKRAGLSPGAPGTEAIGADGVAVGGGRAREAPAGVLPSEEVGAAPRSENEDSDIVHVARSALLSSKLQARLRCTRSERLEG